MVIFANYMQGINYVAPDMGGHTFKPERARQTEGGVKIDLASGKLSSTISYYDILVKDKVRANLYPAVLGCIWYAADAAQADGVAAVQVLMVESVE